MRKLLIFDLDKTVINSNHRYATLSNGDIDLPHWKRNCTPKQIALDTLLPFADFMAAQYAVKGNMIAICTARVMSPFDWKFLNDNSSKIPFHYAMHRPEGCTTADATLKKQQILKLFKELNLSPFQIRNSVAIYDDNPTVLEMAWKLGITGHCSVKLNKQYREAI